MAQVRIQARPIGNAGTSLRASMGPRKACARQVANDWAGASSANCKPASVLVQKPKSKAQTKRYLKLKCYCR
eukprot:1998854-Pleurochrysis_carterae.AAC.1